MTSFATLFELHAALSLEKQWALSAFLGDHDWSIDTELGVIVFNNRHQFPIQILGTESTYSHTWLWSWANILPSDHPTALQSAMLLRDIGNREHIREFSQAEWDLDELSGHQLALVASGLMNADCYYRGPYDGGAIFVLLTAPILETYYDSSMSHTMHIFTQLIASFPIHHRRAMVAYCQHKGYTCLVDQPQALVFGRGGETLRAEFDTEGRILNLETSCVP